jgi:hypothetical protein
MNITTVPIPYSVIEESTEYHFNFNAIPKDICDINIIMNICSIPRYVRI